jgi:hypothetical protein
VLFGPLTAGVLELSAAADIIINGIDSQDNASRVASGDINNDGKDDLIIGAHNTGAGQFPPGQSYVLFGPLSEGTLELSTAVDITVNGIDQSDFSGWSVGSGDINNDGMDDLIIGALLGDSSDGRVDAGETYVVFGPIGAGNLNLSTAADITVHGAGLGDQSGSGVASGDINDDGIVDLIIGAYGARPGGRFAAGESYVLFGPLSAGALELSAAADITITGTDPDDNLGASVASGDINNDGVTDLLIGATGADTGGRSDAGETYVLFGSLPAMSTPTPTPPPFTIPPPTPTLTPAPIPGANQWGLIAMAGSLTAIILWRLRQTRVRARRK